jgi:hypothetical protein
MKGKGGNMGKWRIGVGADGIASRLPSKTSETLAAARTITSEELKRYNGFAFDPGGTARDVTLPAEADAKGWFGFISNEADAAEIITIKNDAGTSFVTPTQNEAAFIWCDGVAWYGLVGATA